MLTLRKVTTDALYIKIRYLFIYKRMLHLKEPDTFFAKINWLKLYDRNPLNEDGPCLIDYKFHCFHGEPTYIQIDRNRFQNHTLDFYDLEWNRLPFGLWFPPSKNTIPKPEP